MTELPETATLTPMAARALIRTIRARLRPRALDELARLYGSTDALAQAQVIGEELRLQNLDRYLLSLVPVVARAGRPFGWDTFRPTLRTTCAPAAGCIETQVDLPFTPENHECVHGPLTLLPIMGLARKFLATRERVSDVERVTWASPLRHRLRLRVWDGASTAPADTADEVLSGCLRTSLGRALAFSGIPDPAHPLLLQRDYNDLSRALVAGTRLDVGTDPDVRSMPLATMGLARCRRALRRRPAPAAALLLDLVPIAILNWKRGRPMMCCGFRDVPLPAPLEQAFADGTHLELRYRRDRSHASTRSGLWIAHYEFRYRLWQERWSTIVMAEADDMAVLLRKLHS